MYPQGLLRQAIGLGLLVALVVLVLGACRGSEKEAKVRPLPEDRQTLRPGTYRSEEFKPSLTFKVGKGWKNGLLESPDNFVITWGDKSWGVGFGTIHRVYESSRRGSPNLVKAPKNLVGWFEHHPYLETSEPKPASIGGIDGKQFDVIVGSLPEEYVGACGAKCVDITRFSDGSLLAHTKGIKAHLIVLEDVKGKTVLMGFSSQASDFDEFAPKAQNVVGSVKWTGS
jgi:hypothetical protein